MEEILKIEGLCKSYESFSLSDVSFTIKPGEIMGFIGRNGAGKTTTLKSIMNLIHYDSGKISVFEQDMKKYELENKQRIGFALSEINYFPQKTLKQLTDVTSRFYKNFDKDKYNRLCNLFQLDVNKKVDQLSSGMKVKYSLAIALSHNAELLILDEPTSGLDPVSRDEILDIFMDIVKNGDRAILFSTHITSDLDKCATNITYIHDGKIKYTGTKKEFVGKYLYVVDNTNDQTLVDKYIHYKNIHGHIEGLIDAADKSTFSKDGITLSEPALDDIMVNVERSTSNENFVL